MTPTITVDTAALDGAGADTISAQASFVAAVRTAFGSLGSSGGMTGTDPAGLVVGRQYDDAASSATIAIVDAVNGVARIGDMLKTSAYNYAVANHYSAIKPDGGPPTKPTATTAFSSHVPPKGEGSLSDAPFGWGIIESIIGMVWPNGDPGKMRGAAQAWIALSDAAATFDGALVGPEVQAKGQDIPEKSHIATAFEDASTSVTGMGNAASAVARGLNTYAQHVDDAHQHLKNLVNDALELATPTGLLSEGWSILSGDGEQLTKIAHEAKEVLDDLEAEAEAVGTLLAPIARAAEAIAQVMAQWTETELQEAADVAQALAADVVNAVASFGNAMIQNPGDTVALIGGALMIDAGVGLEVPGVVLDATGVGAIGGVPLNIAGGALIAGGATLSGGAAIDLTREAAGDSGVTVMHNQVRDAKGRYQGYDKPSADKEAQGVRDYADANPDRTVVPNSRNAQFPEGTGPTKPTGEPRVRKYDAYDMPKDLTPDPDGYVPVKGVEVKSGSAGLSPNQSAFDPYVSAESPAYGTAVLPDGSVVPVKVTEVPPPVQVP